MIDTQSIRASDYPESADLVTGGTLSRLRDSIRAGRAEQQRVQDQHSARFNRRQAIEADITAAHPDSDFHQLAAMLAERDVLDRWLKDFDTQLERTAEQMAFGQKEYSDTCQLYYDARNRLADQETGRHYSRESELYYARQRLVELAGAPSA